MFDLHDLTKLDTAHHVQVQRAARAAPLYRTRRAVGIMHDGRRKTFATGHFLLLTAVCSPLCEAALLANGWRLQTPCNAAIAAELAGVKATATTSDHVHWVAVFKDGGIKPLQMAMFAPPTNPTSVGAPSAIARLDKKAARLDYLRSSILKENPEAVEALGLALDGCIEAWLEHCATANGTNARFEDLQASSTPQSAAVLASRGFCELDDVAIDFTVLGRGESIPTHRARLPGAIVAYERRAGSCDDVLDQAMAQSLLERLRQQPEPVVGTPVAPPREKKDPWAGIKGFGR